MTKSIILFLFYILYSGISYGQDQIGFFVGDLDRTLKEYNEYERIKEHRIDSLKNNLHKRNISNQQLFDLNNQLYEEYKKYHFDSAVHYLDRNLQLAKSLNQSEWINKTELNFAEIFIYSGMFKEAFDKLNSIKQNELPASLKASYFWNFEQLYRKTAVYIHDQKIAPEYERKARVYRDSFLVTSDPQSKLYLKIKSTKDLEEGKLETVKKILSQILAREQSNSRFDPEVAYDLATVYAKEGKTDLQEKFLIVSAIEDIKEVRKENAALRDLAMLLFKKGEIERAYEYLKYALRDARFYNARQRIVEISDVQPIIIEAYEKEKEKQKTRLRNYLLVISVLSLFLILTLVYIYKQNRKLSNAHQNLQDLNKQLHHLNQDLQKINIELQEANEEIQQMNSKLKEANYELNDLNGKLQEANKIKEEYIGYFFNMDSSLFSKINKLIDAINKKIHEGKYEDIKFIVNKVNLKKEKEEVLANFDRVVLKLFPDFVQQFNALFKPEDHIKLKDGQLLNTELRIFALIRMGIAGNEKIAEILEYSVNTINTYKTKIKNKSIVPNEEFEAKIMAIKTY